MVVFRGPYGPESVTIQEIADFRNSGVRWKRGGQTVFASDYRRLWLLSNTCYLQQIPLYKLLVQSLAQGRRAVLNNGPASFERQNLALGAAFAARDDGSSMAHAASLRGRDARDEADDGLVFWVVGFQKLGRVFLSRPSDLSNHDDSVRLVVLQEHRQRVDEVCTREGVTADSGD